jgi:hypothetical protein
MMHGTSTIVNPQFNDQLYVLQFQELCDVSLHTNTAVSNVMESFGHAKNPAYAVVWSIVLFWGKIL